MTPRTRHAIPVPGAARNGAQLTAALLAAVLLTSCGGADQTDDPAPTPEETMSNSADPSPSADERRHSPVVDQAIEDLSARVSVPAESIEVISEEEVTWRDGSLGCAEKGMSYTQALVDGKRVVLRVDGEEYEYHSGRSGPPEYCADPTE